MVGRRGPRHPGQEEDPSQRHPTTSALVSISPSARRPGRDGSVCGSPRGPTSVVECPRVLFRGHIWESPHWAVSGRLTRPVRRSGEKRGLRSAPLVALDRGAAPALRRPVTAYFGRATPPRRATRTEDSPPLTSEHLPAGMIAETGWSGCEEASRVRRRRCSHLDAPEWLPAIRKGPLAGTRPNTSTTGSKWVSTMSAPPYARPARSGALVTVRSARPGSRCPSTGSPEVP